MESASWELPRPSSTRNREVAYADSSCGYGGPKTTRRPIVVHTSGFARGRILCIDRDENAARHGDDVDA